MRNSPLKLKNIDYILSAFVLSFFLSCNGENSQTKKNQSIIPEVREMKAHQAKVFLTYIDSIVKLPDTKFNDAGIRFLNKRFLSELPLGIHDSIKEGNRKDIFIQYYQNNETYLEVGSGIIFLIPETITDSLVVADFTDYFGHIKTEKPLIGITAQPLPVHIRVSSHREIKLTFKNNENRDQAGVTTVEVLNLNKERNE